MNSECISLFFLKTLNTYSVRNYVIYDGNTCENDTFVYINRVG